jgi:hypothetical protein
LEVRPIAIGVPKREGEIPHLVGTLILENFLFRIKSGKIAWITCMEDMEEILTEILIRYKWICIKRTPPPSDEIPGENGEADH